CTRRPWPSPPRRRPARSRRQTPARPPAPRAPLPPTRAPLHHDRVLLEELVQVLAVHVGLARGAGDVALGALHEPAQIALLELVLPLLLVVAVGKRRVERARQR